MEKDSNRPKAGDEWTDACRCQCTRKSSSNIELDVSLNGPKRHNDSINDGRHCPKAKRFGLCNSDKVFMRVHLINTTTDFWSFDEFILRFQKPTGSRTWRKVILDELVRLFTIKIMVVPKQEKIKTWAQLQASCDKSSVKTSKDCAYLTRPDVAQYWRSSC